MNKFHPYNSNVFSSLLLTGMITIGYPYFNHQAIASELAKQIAQNNSQEQINKPKTRARSSILESIWKLLKAKREQEPALSSRSNICEISPGLLGNVNVIYSDRPLFIWQEKATNVTISLYTPFSWEQGQEILWSETVNNDSQKIRYQGKPLEAGKIYDWELANNTQSHQRRISFQIMNADKRDSITRDLEKLNIQLKNNGVTAEDITLARANYFAQQDLWSDALQEIFSVENPSTLLMNNAQEIVKYICVGVRN
jgi:hypothetical protein